MRYEINRRAGFLEDVFGVEYLLEKVIDGGESYLIASFKDEGHAIGALAMMSGSLEVERGAQIVYGSWATEGK